MQKLQSSRMKLAEQARNVWRIVPIAGTKLDELLDPTYWSHVTGNLRECDRIEAICEDMSWVAELIVIKKSGPRVTVAVLSVVSLSEAVRSNEINTEVEDVVVAWKGPQHKHSVIRKKTNEILRSGFTEKGEAEKWAKDHMKAVAA